MMLSQSGLLHAQAASSSMNEEGFVEAFEDSSQKLDARSEKKSPKGAMLRSLAFPGWGQWYNGQKIKAALVFSTQATLVALSFHFDSEASKSPPGSAERERDIDRRNSMYWIMGGVTLLSMLDAYIDAHLSDFDTGPDLAVRIGILPPQTGRLPQHTAIAGVSLRAQF
ncbi:hypothetical protein GWO43_21355 [candidate division KSB1 bacterium]|nr:hypothetical protein [candidate division KSB1 bacterium]NIT73373.1 hypothetical protein [candidate division KSB1 bacterium]NIX73053.1 hypothetical protein [candidate division KSB1 bacterium]